MAPQRRHLSDFTPRAALRLKPSKLTRKVTREALIITIIAALMLTGTYIMGAVVTVVIGWFAWKWGNHNR